MSNTKSFRTYAMLAAACFLIVGLWIIIQNIIEGTDFYTLGFATMVVCAVYLALGIFLIVAKRNKSFAIITSVMVLLCIYYVIESTSVYDILDCLAWMSLFMLTLLTGSTTTKLKAKVLRSLWFLPTAVLLLGELLPWIQHPFWWSIYMPLYWMYFIQGLIEVAGFLFFGIWLKKGIAKEPDTGPAFAGEYAAAANSSAQSAHSPAPIIGGADQLLKYKELLDYGAITQEEFDEKKAQILG